MAFCSEMKKPALLKCRLSVFYGVIKVLNIMLNRCF